MAITLRATARTGMMTAIVTDAGASAKGKLYDGTKPASLGAPAGALKATLTFGSVIGTVASGVLTFGSVSQSNGSHVAGTPTFLRITTSADVAVADIDIGGTAPKFDFTGTVASGTDVTLTGLTWTAPHA